MDIMKILKEEMVEVNFAATSKKDLLQKISGKYSDLYREQSQEVIYQALEERESLGSTGFGNAIALPHAKLPGIGYFSLFVATLKKGVDFQSRDNRKVRLVIAILGPEGEDREYLSLLAQISKMIRQETIIKELLNSTTGYDLFRTFLRNFSSLTQLTPAPKVKEIKEKMLLIHLKEEKFLHEIVNVLVERGIYNTVISESATFENYISKSALFSGFLDFLSERSGTCKTIMAPVPGHHIPALIGEIEAIMGDLDKYEGIYITALDILFQKGTLS
jgi:PTS system nitrogen regulatory IIA component